VSRLFPSHDQGWSSKMNKTNRAKAKALYKQVYKLYLELINKRLTIKDMQELDKDTVFLPYAVWRVIR
jgi:hypothetical protein